MTELYDTTLGPVLKAVVTEEVGAFARDLHPMRQQRRSFGSANTNGGPIERMS
jgi:hypothetical protein